MRSDMKAGCAFMYLFYVTYQHRKYKFYHLSIHQRERIYVHLRICLPLSGQILNPSEPALVHCTIVNAFQKYCKSEISLS
jgi:hypothetical protein